MVISAWPRRSCRTAARARHDDLARVARCSVRAVKGPRELHEVVDEWLSAWSRHDSWPISLVNSWPRKPLTRTFNRAPPQRKVKNVSAGGRGGLGVMRQQAVRRCNETWSCGLFGCWDLSAPSGVVELGGREQRLVALLALRGRTAAVADRRNAVAGHHRRPRADEPAVGRAASSSVGRGLAGVQPLDAGAVGRRARRRAASGALGRGDHRQPPVDDRWWVNVLRRADLLPGWYEDWVVFERERLQHLRLACPRVRCMRTLSSGDHDTALTAASRRSPSNRSARVRTRSSSAPICWPATTRTRCASTAPTAASCDRSCGSLRPGRWTTCYGPCSFRSELEEGPDAAVAVAKVADQDSARVAPRTRP